MKKAVLYRSLVPSVITRCRVDLHTPLVHLHGRPAVSVLSFDLLGPLGLFRDQGMGSSTKARPLEGTSKTDFDGTQLLQAIESNNSNALGCFRHDHLCWHSSLGGRRQHQPDQTLRSALVGTSCCLAHATPGLPQVPAHLSSMSPRLTMNASEATGVTFCQEPAV